MPSDEDYSTDESKRKREMDTDDIFKRSKKVYRTPDKQTKMDEKLDKLIELIQNLSGEMQQVRTEQKEYRKEIEMLREENMNLKLENENIKKEFEEVKSDLKDLNLKFEYWDKEKRRNNIIIYGLKMDTNEGYILKEEAEKFLKEQLEIEVTVKKANRIGQQVCLVALNNMEDKIKVMENKSKLRKMENDRIYINNDLTKKERDIQKSIRKRAEEEKKEGRNVKIGYQKLEIDGKQWRWNNNSDKLEVSEKNRPWSKN